MTILPAPRLRTRIGIAAASVVLAGATALALVGGAGTGLGGGDGVEQQCSSGIAVAFVAFLVLLRLARTVASRIGLVAGALIAAEGFAIGWLGHMGGLEAVPGVVLLLAAALAAPRPRLLLVLAALGATGLLAAAFGVVGQYLTYALDPGGGDCLSGWAGDPSQYPLAASQPGAITMTFSWIPLGRACSWTDGGTTTTLVQTSAATTTAVVGTAVVGAALVLASVIGRLARGAAR